ncbi:MAG TPA: acetolactate synthase small subunit, partial [Candidatus Acidoferrales bacterium]|nr:acetolactate synthase small subunit [Candidatus Acidoferrales bacterium]
SLAFIKVAANDESRYRLMEIARVFRARVVDLANESLVIEITGTEDKVDALVGVLRPFGILEMARTGQVVMSRGTKPPANGHSAGRNDLLLEEEASQSV